MRASTARQALRLGLPVQNECDRERGFPGDVHQESLTVWRHHVVPRIVGARRDVVAAQVRSEQRRSRANIHPRHIELDWHAHEPVVWGEVEELLAVVPPALLNAASAGNPDPGSRTRKLLDVYLDAAGLIRLKRDPFAVGRELSVLFIECGFDYGKRLSIAIERQGPDVIARGSALPRIEDKPSIA